MTTIAIFLLLVAAVGTLAKSATISEADLEAAPSPSSQFSGVATSVESTHPLIGGNFQSHASSSIKSDPFGPIANLYNGLPVPQFEAGCPNQTCPPFFVQGNHAGSKFILFPGTKCINKDCCDFCNLFGADGGCIPFANPPSCLCVGNARQAGKLP